MTAADHKELAFVQKRVAVFGLVVGGCFGFFLAFRALMLLTTGSANKLTQPSMVYHALATLGFLGAWALCRRGTRTARQVAAIELGSLTIGIVCSMLVCANIPITERPEYILLLALTYAVVARSIWVPSSARRSIVISVAIGGVLVLGVYQRYESELGVELVRQTGRWGGALLSQEWVGLLQAVYTGAWWCLTTFIASATSHVIYGLRRQVRDARRLGQYRLEAKLGEGGMGVVYKASHAMLKRPTAVKLLRQKLPSESQLRRFEHEVRQTARLSHPNVITIYDFGRTADGIFYYAMEYIDGVNLGQVVARDGPMSAARAVHVLERICAALVEAHGAGLIHRDIKPANVMLYLPHEYGGVPEGVKLLDFGLVQQMQHGPLDAAEREIVRGTPQYMAPEAIQSPQDIDARTDLYAVGAVGYYLLTGRHVFSGGSLAEVCSHHLHTQPVAPSLRTEQPIPCGLESLILRCLAKLPDGRPPSAFDLQQEFARCRPQPEWSAEQARRWWQQWRAERPASGEALPTPNTEIAIDLARWGRRSETSPTRSH